MVNKELIDYIEQCRKLGHSDSQIQGNLLKEGWTQADVLEAMFKYAKPKKKKSFFLACVILSVILIALTTAGAIFMLNDIQKTSAEIAEMTRDIHSTSGREQGLATLASTDLGFSVQYPEDKLVLDREKATLTHTLKNFHKLSLKDGTDLGLAEDIKIVFKKDVSECDNADSILAGSGMPFSKGELSGIKYEMGAEGEGIVLFCVKNSENKNIFVVERYFLSEGWSAELVNQPDFISSPQQEEITDQILSSFKFSI